MRHVIFGTVVGGVLVFWAVQAAPAALFQPQSPTPAPQATADVQATIQRAVEQTQVAVAATQVASVPTAAPPAAAVQPRLAPAPPVVPTPVPVRPTAIPTMDRSAIVGQQFVVGSLGYLVPDGKGKELAGDATLAVLTQDPLTLLKAAANGSIYHLNGGTHVQVLDLPGPHGTHVRVLDGPHTGAQGAMLNRSLGI